MQTIAMNRYIPCVSNKSCLLAVGALGTMALFMLAWAYPTFPGDEGALVRFQALRNDWLDSTAVAFANMGLFWVFVPVAMVLTVCLILARRYADATMIVAAGVVIGIGNGLKTVVDRPRPDYQIVQTQSDLSFPSGHTLLAVVFGGVLVYLVGLWVKPVLARRVIQVGIMSAVVTMGASRVYLGVHWPSDVIGAYAFGAMAVIGLIGLRNAMASAR